MGSRRRHGGSASESECTSRFGWKLGVGVLGTAEREKKKGSK